MKTGVNFGFANSRARNLVKEMKNLILLLVQSWITVLVLVLDMTKLVSSCQGQRSVLTNLAGTITDGNQNYLEGVKCEWLIRAPHRNQSITLTFEEFETECSFDFLFVFDGGQFTSPLLASFSGVQKPGKVISSSNEMLILLYSDKNFVLKGFKAAYKVTECQDSCSKGGQCIDGKCSCGAGRAGPYCQYEWCPLQCGSLEGKGECSTVDQKCICNPGFYGESCSSSVLPKESLNSWSFVTSGSIDFSGRAGHVACYISETDHIWIHGGFSFNGIMSDLLSYHVNTSKWQTHNVNGNVPIGRYFHSGGCYQQNLVFYGGQTSPSDVSNEFWIFNMTSKKWRLLIDNGTEHPPALTGHSSTFVNDFLYIIGGRASDDTYSTNIYKYDLRTESGWEVVVSRIENKQMLHLVGHSAVFHQDSRSIFVFGGLTPKANTGRVVQTNQMFVYHVGSNIWSSIHPLQPDTHRLAPPLAYHSANIVGDFIIVYGGLTNDDGCYEADLFFYNLKCHFWVNSLALEFLSPAPNGFRPPSRGRYAHSAVVKNHDTILVVGGFDGQFLKDVVAYRVPEAVTLVTAKGISARGGHCSRYTGKNACYDDPACGWCFDSLQCYSLDEKASCRGQWVGKYCPGACAAFSQCESCVTGHWSAKCSWCVQDSKCYPTSSPDGKCSNVAGPDQRGWWGNSSVLLSDVGMCQTKDRRPGLTYMIYYQPQMMEYPDYVTIVSSPVVSLSSVRDGLRHSGSTVIIKGFLFPYLFNFDPSKAARRVFLQGAQVSATFFLSDSDYVANKQLVATIPESSSVRDQEASRTDGRLLFPTPTPTKSYYLECVGNLSTYTTAQLVLEWDLTTSSAMFREVIQTSYIQPFHSDKCSAYATCMACIADSSCGWCSATSSCEATTSWMSCVQGQVNILLIRNQTQCPLCRHYPSCQTCAQDKKCGWSSETSLCVRRGLQSHMIINSPECPPSCSRRSSCQTCVTDSQCSWCHAKSMCFPSSQYLDRFSFGQCLTWSERSSVYHQCGNCSRHSTCSTCLADYRCGWCGDNNNPLIGRCIPGDFKGPEQGSICTAYFASSSWSYSRCPDVDECRLNLHNCNGNATCSNTYGSFVCSCNRGYTGDGVKECRRTCYHHCVNGYCGANYECECSLGWLGPNCTTDCGCNGHSSCSKGIGNCDQCHNNTAGQSCEFCQSGTFGNATDLVGCTPCQCNGHGDEAQGICHSSTGKCFCKDDTTGNQCEQCVDGTVGDPRNNGFCFHPCDAHSVVANRTSGFISSASGPGVASDVVYCKWLISAFMYSSHNLVYGQQPLNAPIVSVQLTFRHVHSPCSSYHVKIYDGVPDNPRGTGLKETNGLRQIGTVCGYDASATPQFLASSGNIIVVYVGKQGPLPKGAFLASFQVIRCPDSCHQNGKCVIGASGKVECVCNSGWHGPLCNQQLCPANCSEDKGKGHCAESQNICVCGRTWGGAACSYSLPPSDFLWSRVSAMFQGDASLLPTYGYAISSYGKDDSLLIFGGMTGNEYALNTVWKFSHVTNITMELKTGDSETPLGRYYHCAVVVKDTLVVFGGMTRDVQLNDLWILHLGSLTWSKSPLLGLPNLVGHSCTVVDDIIYVVGGYSMSEGLNEDYLHIDISTMKWKHLKTEGFGPAGIYGHSAAYYPKDGTIFIYGGVAFYEEKVQISNRLYSFNVPTLTWNYLATPHSLKPPSIALHSSSIHNDVMYVTGGFSSSSNLEFNNKIITLNLNCLQWGVFQISGEEREMYRPKAGVQISLISMSNKIYSFGSTAEGTVNGVYALETPADICALLRSKSDCLESLGCTWCALGTKEESGVCYTTTNAKPFACTSAGPSDITSSAPCSRFLQRSCTSFKSCVSCLATHPGASGPSCSWCQCSDNSFCTSKSGSCGNCTFQLKSVTECLEMKCESSSCQSCGRSVECMWTRHFVYGSELLRIFSRSPINPWNCFTTTLEKHVTHPITDKAPPHPCPNRCITSLDCTSCLDNNGADGGTSSCVWSSLLNKCLSTTAISIFCARGACGTLHDSNSKCPKPCALYTTCSACLRKPNCGWCAVDDDMGNGQCLEGGVRGAISGTCAVADPGKPVVFIVGQNVTASSSSNARAVWATLLCPLENECKNGRHSCRSNERCVDLPDGFSCICLPGYEKDERGVSCIPICSKGCIRGTCILPERCKCQFGWTGFNCSVPCLCNGHSNCPNASMANVCTKCENNTQGKYCEECKPLFVGDPKEGGTCESCVSFCNNRATVCLNTTEYNLLPVSQKDPESIRIILEKGASDPTRTVCVDCDRQSQGSRCETCRDGYFHRNGSCSPCLCNGHGDTCDKTTGENCNCGHNTETDNSCKTDCWLNQCTKCKEGYAGEPANGRQCYRKLSTLETVVIGTESNPLGGPRTIKGLPGNSSLFFVTLPKYTNVDIRITIDIFNGAADLLISTSENSFAMALDQEMGIEIIKVLRNSRKKRSIDRKTLQRSRRATESESPTVDYETISVSSNNRLSTFVNFEGGILRISGMYRRTVITLPHVSHDFRKVKFYCALVTKGSESSEMTSGVIYSRQELSKIDLFVFFSVFFSIFFLILSTFVLVWKGKQAYNARVAARNHQIDVETMESRPFASYTMQIERNEPIETFKRHRSFMLGTVSKRGKQAHKGGTVFPMAVEPTEDGCAAVVTLLVQFPENELSSWNLALGSALANSSAQQLVSIVNSTQGTTGRKHNTRILTTVT